MTETNRSGEQRRIGRLIVVRAVWDPEAGVWVAESEDVPGLVAEAESIEALEVKLPGLIQDLLGKDEGEGYDIEIPVHIIAESFSRVQVRAPAA
jgi:predicted RNase H-like HicB family nuclease